MLLFEIVLGSPPEHIVCALPIEPADGAEQEEHARRLNIASDFQERQRQAQGTKKSCSMKENRRFSRKYTPPRSC